MNEKNKLTPCGSATPCDIVCDSDYDITDIDLMILSNQEPEDELVNEDANSDLDPNKVRKLCKERRANRKKELQAENAKEGGKKRPCRKVIKNPFFTNRLKFSSDLPPRPAVPPPQFFPLADEDSKPKVCQKKKKCKKKKKQEPECDKTEEEEKEEEKEEEEEEECAGGPCKCINEDDLNERPRKPCKKTKDKGFGPCRKKVSESSIPPQPRRIPALLKDLPLTCPKDIPEVERQIWMSQDRSFERNICRKRCKKKKVVEQLLNS